MSEKVRTTRVAIIIVYILHNIDVYPLPPLNQCQLSVKISNMKQLLQKLMWIVFYPSYHKFCKISICKIDG